MRQNTHAVSPVVGVMLMLVVTIIIAAIVSAFSGGLVGTPHTAPSAAFDVHIYALQDQDGCFYTPTMTIHEISGDSLPTKDLKIVTAYTSTGGSVFSGNLSGEVAVPGNANWQGFTSSQYSGVLVLNTGKQFGSFISNSPTVNSAWFGDESAILSPGYYLTTAALFCGNNPISSDSCDGDPITNPHDNPGMDYLLGFNVIDQIQKGGFGTGSVVEIRIIHIPSGSIIYDRKVNVE